MSVTYVVDMVKVWGMDKSPPFAWGAWWDGTKRMPHFLSPNSQVSVTSEWLRPSGRE